ncbi:hypothetical protein DA2_0422 [Desulfovibrio sp. A2]|nr:hypothetical protein DA2_0422 [Desulfovibrio sp. A2]
MPGRVLDGGPHVLSFTWIMPSFSPGRKPPAASVFRAGMPAPVGCRNNDAPAGPGRPYRPGAAAR